MERPTDQPDHRIRMVKGLILPAVVAVAGAAVAVVGLFTPWTQGEPVPYAPGEDAQQARTSAATASGYASGNVILYEGDLISVRQAGAVEPGSFWITLGSGAPEIFFWVNDKPLAFNVGDHVRVWTTNAYITPENADGTYAVRVDSKSDSWHVPYWEYGNNPAGHGVNVPVFYVHGSGSVQSVIHFGGLSVGSVVSLAGLALLYRRRPGFSRSRTVDHIAVWCGGSAVVAGIIGVRLFADASWLLLVSAVLGFTALAAGIVGLVGRKQGQLWWPFAAGATAGLASLAFAAFIFLEVVTHLYF